MYQNVPIYAIASLLLLCSLPFAASGQETVLIRQWMDEEGVLHSERRNLSAAATKDFRWQDHAGKEGHYLLLRTENIPADEATNEDFPAAATHGPLLPLLSRIRTIDEDGTVKEYTWNQAEDLSTEANPSYRNFSRSDSGPEDDFPSLFVEEMPGTGGLERSLTWIGRGECPDDYQETEIRSGTRRIFLLDDEGKLRMTRHVSVKHRFREDGSSQRLVEVAIVTYR